MADMLDQIDLATNFDFTLEEAPGFLDPPEVSREEIAILRETGLRARNDRLNGRRFPITGVVASADNDTAKSKIRLLKSVALRGVRSTVDIRLDDFVGYKVLGKYAGFTATPLGPQRYTRAFRVTMEFRAVNPPSFVKLAGSTVPGITTSDVEIPQGTAPPINAVLAILEPTDPTITIKDHNGNTIGTPMAFDFTPVSGEYLVFDISKGEIYRNLTGVPGGTEASALWTPGTTLIRFDKDEWDAVTETWMTMAISSGVGELTYEQCDF
jgi:hypothetical protein